LEALSKPELLALLKAAKEHSTRNWLMILLAYSHGLRASEVVAIKRDDIKEEFFHVKRKKRSLVSRQSLHRDANSLLDEHSGLLDFIASVRGNQRLFPVSTRQFQRIVKRHAEEAGLAPNKRHPHMLKHTMGAEIYEKTKDLRLVRMRLGHKREASSLIYSGRVAEQAANAQVELLIGSDSV
jgi:type 1 fimbriae regulatory protein FimB